MEVAAQNSKFATDEQDVLARIAMNKVRFIPHRPYYWLCFLISIIVKDTSLT